ncbi:hypothetical protein LMG31884_46180 (plasmid) [Xanthomonas hydrangeae]|uniref:hypothetical protein n=1 Tax=Xanthomonas hydrangeae TaxID=2775159 RepID=UPI001AFA3ADE|nr:hypothetical protein LMG31884_46180 [Xanthomonas hydrangeae]CAD7740052.1 hypothetical protein LMG31884_46180 [Xanthomonas hydrangeae]
MYPFFIVALFLALCGALVNVVMKKDARTDSMRQQRMRTDQARVAEGLDRYITERGQAPPSLDALAATPGFEHVRGSRNQWQGYVASGTLNDGTWRYQRAAAWSVRRKDGGTNYPNENECGTGSAASASSWCGSKDGTWYRNESRGTYANEITQQRIKQQRTLQLLADQWTARQEFPAKGNDGVTLASGQQRTLASLVGYTGSATTCTGVYVWAGMPLDCTALYDVWGGPVGYQYQSSRYIVLVSEAPIQTASGNNVLVASPLQVQE